MKIAVTVTTCHQIGIDEWKDGYTTKIFEYSATLQQIEDWIKSIDKSSSILKARLSFVAE
jgi:hypothetical protein